MVGYVIRYDPDITFWVNAQVEMKKRNWSFQSLADVKVEEIKMPLKVFYNYSVLGRNVCSLTYHFDLKVKYCTVLTLNLLWK